MTLYANMLRKWFATYNTSVISPCGVYYFVWFQATRMFEIFTTDITGMMPYITGLSKLKCFVNGWPHILQFNIILWYVLFRVLLSNQNVWNIFNKYYRYDASLVLGNFISLKANMLCKWFTTYITNVILPSGVYYFVWFQATRMFEIFTISITGMMLL